MNTNSVASHDPAPLLLVRNEIDHSLTKARENLDAASADALAFQTVASNLHQVTGALLMVGLTAAARLTEETEKLADTLNSCPPSDSKNRVQIIKQSISSISTYLDGLVDGNTDRPMMLAASYLSLNEARGAENATPYDLFQPDLSAAASELNTVGTLPQDAIPVEAISRCRTIFQAGLLKLMRNKDLVGGASHMCDAILAIEALDASSPSRDFWFSTIAFFDAVINDPTGARQFAVPLFGKIDQQIKRLMDGDHHVPEKVFRDLLLVIGKSAARTRRIARVRQLYQLDDLLWFPDGATQNAPDKKLIPVVDELRRLINGMKSDLQSFAEGHTSALKTLSGQAAKIAKIGQHLPNREMVRLLHLLGAVGAHLSKTGSRPSVSQALEIATALLFAESSLETYFQLTEEFDRQASRTCSRIKNVMTGVELPDFNLSVASLADTKTLQAQTHLLVIQVGQEIQANLAIIESALDSFFRDPAKKSGLAAIGSLFSQVRGAFSIIEESEAASLAKLLADRIAKFASGDVLGEGEEADLVAEGVSGLGLYVTGLQQGSQDAYTKLVPTLVRFGIAERPSPISIVQRRDQSTNAGAQGQPESGKSPNNSSPAVWQLPQTPQLAPSTLSEAVDLKSTEKSESPKKTEPVVQLLNAANNSAVQTEVVANKGDVRPPAIGTEMQPESSVVKTRVQPGVAGDANAVAVQLQAMKTAIAISESKRLEQSLTELQVCIEERDQRIRGLQAQLVSLHREAREAAGLRAELKNLRALLADANIKAN